VNEKNKNEGGEKNEAEKENTKNTEGFL